jgi:elongation factor P
VRCDVHGVFVAWFDTPCKRGVNRRAMYDTSDIRKGLKVLMDGNPYTIIEFQFVKPGKGAAFTRTKFKNLLTGAVIERNIRSGEKLEPANVETKDMQFLYKEGSDLVFMDQSNYEQVSVSQELVGDAHDLMKDNMPCTVTFFNERPVDISLPTFVFLEVTASEPGVRGDTSGNVQKPATVETGAAVSVPLFIRVGDTIKIDTRTHEYVERVNKT